MEVEIDFHDVKIPDGAEWVMVGATGYPELSDHLREQLARVPSVYAPDWRREFRPCSAHLKDGSVIERLYPVQAIELRYVQEWPTKENDPSLVLANEIENLEDSPYRTPPSFANILYQSGESGMGWTVFTVVFKSGFRQVYVTGQQYDFLEYPKGLGPGDIVDVLPYEGRQHRDDPSTLHDIRAVPLCIYGSAESPMWSLRYKGESLCLASEPKVEAIFSRKTDWPTD